MSPCETQQQRSQHPLAQPQARRGVKFFAESPYQLTAANNCRCDSSCIVNIPGSLRAARATWALLTQQPLWQRLSAGCTRLMHPSLQQLWHNSCMPLTCNQPDTTLLAGAALLPAGRPLPLLHIAMDRTTEVSSIQAADMHLCMACLLYVTAALHLGLNACT